MLWIQSQRIILASSSPRRRELLKEAGIEFEIHSPEVDESIIPGESPEAMVRRLSVDKGEAIAAKFPDRFILAADTTVVLNGIIIGKPESKLEAEQTLQKMQGTTHQVIGGIAIINKEKNILWSEVYCSEVTMTPLSPEIITRYVATEEPMDKAGSYAIQGIGSQFIANVTGSYSNVVGLNVSAVIEQLKKFKIVT